jgi:hypothetical protein
MLNAERGRGLARVLMLLLLLLFALFALLTAAYGVRMYRSISGSSDANYALRASITYVSGKIRALDSTGFLSVEQIGGMDVLVLSEIIEGSVYHTYIYVHDGQLCELFTDEHFPFDPSAGIPLVEVERVSFALDGGALSITATAPTGETRFCRTMFRSSTGGAA